MNLPCLGNFLNNKSSRIGKKEKVKQHFSAIIQYTVRSKKIKKIYNCKKKEQNHFVAR